MDTTGATLTAPLIQPTNRDGVYRARSDSGNGTYLCSPVGAGWCECPAAQYARDGKPCKHVERAHSFVADALRARAKARGIVVLAGPSSAEMLGDDRELDLYGPAEHCGLDECDCEDYAG
jgi:hypothetical protein